ncbi:hypothetical protein C942_00122 [Photobacterium marinum]|uniref:Uncharacterized protein n=1 Tax=Photobacterium marinum TaxID=1056511 RepID=L8JG74_9GAMM|nr:hypothetical protein C942_00122 [Photobacterium marinum]
MKISDLNQRCVEFELNQSKDIIQGLLDGEDINPELLKFILKKMESLLAQVED